MVSEKMCGEPGCYARPGNLDDNGLCEKHRPRKAADIDAIRSRLADARNAAPWITKLDDDVATLLAEVAALTADRDRTLALPIIRTCMDCSHRYFEDDGPDLCAHVEGKEGGRPIEPDAGPGYEPPVWCPLRTHR